MQSCEVEFADHWRCRVHGQGSNLCCEPRYLGKIAAGCGLHGGDVNKSFANFTTSPSGSMEFSLKGLSKIDSSWPWLVV